MARLLPEGLPDVRESDDAGRFYCAHALFSGHLAAERGLAPILSDDEEEPLVGFLHVPPDQRTVDLEAPLESDRHQDTAVVVAAALAGFAAPLLRREARDTVRVVVTGFGAFRDVKDNPTGAFVRSRAALERSLALAFGDVSSTVHEEDGALRARLCWDGAKRELVVVAVELPVDDRCLAFRGEGSLHALLEDEGAHAWLGLGVCRSPYFRAETLPHDGGLELTSEGARHDGVTAPSRYPRRSRALVRALERGGTVVAERARTSG